MQWSRELWTHPRVNAHEIWVAQIKTQATFTSYANVGTFVCMAMLLVSGQQPLVADLSSDIMYRYRCSLAEDGTCLNKPIVRWKCIYYTQQVSLVTVHCGVAMSWLSDWESVPAGCYTLSTRESTLLLIADPGKGQNSKYSFHQALTAFTLSSIKISLNLNHLKLRTVSISQSWLKGHLLPG